MNRLTEAMLLSALLELIRRRLIVRTLKPSTPMREQIDARLLSLKTEREKGQLRLHQLQDQLSAVQNTMLRINGAIMVLEEILSTPPQTPPDNGQHSPVHSFTGASPFTALKEGD